MYNDYQFEFGTQDGTGAPLNILQGQCIINIPLDCLYHNVKPPIQIPRNILPDPIPIDFFFVQNALTNAYGIQGMLHNIGSVLYAG